MKRSAKIYMVLLVWIAAALQFFINKKMDIEEVFAGVQEADAQMQIDADVSAWGVYQVAHSHLTPTAIKNLLLNTAEYFCLTSGELTVTGQDEYITTFQSNGESELWRITFLVDSNTGQSYLIFHTDNIEAVDRIHTFYDDLNIDEVGSVEADISLQPSGKDPLLEKLLAELPVTGLTQTPEGWYGRLNSNGKKSGICRRKCFTISSNLSPMPPVAT